MGKWNDQLKRILETTERNKQRVEELEARCGEMVTAAQAFIGTHAKGAGKLSKGWAEVMDAAEESARAVAELSVCEDEYEAAKKAKDKNQMKEADDKMKPLIKTFESAKKTHIGALDELTKTTQDLNGALEALAAASAAS